MNLATILALTSIRPVLVTNIRSDEADMFLGLCKQGYSQKMFHYVYSAGRALFWAEKDNAALGRYACSLGTHAAMGVDCIQIEWHF